MNLIELIRQGKVNGHFETYRKLNIPNLVYYVTQRATGKESLFLEKCDYIHMLDLLQEISQRYALKVFAFCFMPNNLHLLIRPDTDNLDRAMQGLFSRYASTFNEKYERKGHLFGAPYRQAVCFENTHILASSLYIHLSPVHARLSGTPQAYPWSSCRLYWNGNDSKSFLDPDFILGLLPEDNDGERRKTYQELLTKGKKLEAGHILEQKDTIDRFRSDLAAIFPSLFRQMDSAYHISQSLGIDLLSIEDLENQIEEIRMGYFTNGRSTRMTKRQLVEQLMVRGHKRSQIAERLGISRKTVYNLLKTEFDVEEDLEM